MYNLNKFNKKENKINLVSLKFSPKIYHKLKRNELSKLTKTARDFFHLLAEFAKVNNLTNKMTVIMVNDEVQETFNFISIKFLWTPTRKVKLYLMKSLLKRP